jgi:outer membrane receptor protein involved in Fe transport
VRGGLDPGIPGWNKNVLIYFATGLYSQPAFFKELKDPYGKINKNLKAQKSIHYVLGSDYMFYAFSKPFKLSAEAYYKSFDNLVPYYIDNVRTVYAGKNMAKAYTTGVDLKINGEFVKGAESWLNISIMQSRQDIYNDYYTVDTTFTNKEKTSYILNDTIRPGYFPTPTDQLINLGLYFQDYLPRYPSYRVHLSLHYGSSLPVSIPMNKKWNEVYRILPSYKRVDLGVSKMLKGPETVVKPGSFLSYFKEVWLSAEIFNLIGINNTVSYMWVKTVSSDKDLNIGYFAVPNYLTSRRFNIKLTASF